MLPSELLKRGWCQGFGAVDKNGSEVVSTSEEAHLYCMAGALSASQIRYRRISPSKRNAIATYLDNFAEELGYQNYIEYNDDISRTEEEIIVLMKKAEQYAGIVDENSGIKYRLRRNVIKFQKRPIWSILEFLPNSICEYCQHGQIDQNGYCEPTGHWFPIYGSTDLSQVLDKLAQSYMQNN